MTNRLEVKAVQEMHRVRSPAGKPDLVGWASEQEWNYGVERYSESRESWYGG
jgi:hypothetical protein